MLNSYTKYQSVPIHVLCPKEYTRKSSILAVKRQREEEAGEEKKNKKRQDIRRKIHQVSTLWFKDSVLEVAGKRNDAIAKAVMRRIIYEHDLVAEGLDIILIALRVL